MKLTLNQWRAMMLKKMLFTWSNKLMFLVQNLICVLFVILTVLVSRNQGQFQPLPAMTFSRGQYPKTVTVMERADTLTPNSDMAKVADRYEAIAKSEGGSHTFESTGDLNFTEYILQIAKDDQPVVNSRYLVGASIEDDKITAWLNNKPLHTAPLTLDAVHNALAQKYIGEDAEIEVTNWPYPYSTQTELKRLNLGNSLGTQMAANLCFAMCFVSSMYLIFLIKERASRAKLLQFVSGVRVWTFWTSAYLWDMLTYTFICVIVIITIVCFQEVGLKTGPELGRYFLILWLFGWSVLPGTYLCSFLFTDAASGFARVSIFNIFVGVAMFFMVLIMGFDAFELKNIANTIASIFRCFPHFSLAMGLNSVYSFAATEAACEKAGALPDILVCELIPACCSKYAPSLSISLFLLLYF